MKAPPRDSCEILVAEGFEVNVAGLDQGEDPDTFIRKKGLIRFVKIADLAAVFEYPAGSCRGSADLATTSGADGFCPACSPWRQLFQTRRHGTSSPTGLPTSAVLQKRLVRRNPEGGGGAEDAGLAAGDRFRGHIRDAEALLWWIINSPAEAENALKDLDPRTRRASRRAKSLRWPGPCTRITPASTLRAVQRLSP